jgi:DNA-binding beta-propeller fold protein YncE
LSKPSWLLCFGSLLLLLIVAAGCTAQSSLEANAGPPLWGIVGESLVLDGSASIGARVYHWDFGDDSSSSGTESRVEHRWDEPGHYRAVLEVEDDAGRRASTALRVDVVRAPLDVSPQRSGRLAANLEQTLLFAALPDFDAVAVLDVENETVAGHLSVCSNPVAVAHSNEDSLLAVACATSGEIEIWDSATLEKRETLQLAHGAEPRAVLFRDGMGLLVLEGARGTLFSYDLVDEVALSWQVEGLVDPLGMAVVGNTLFVSRWRSPEDGGRWWRLDLGTEELGEPLAEEFVLALDQTVDSDTSNRGVPNYVHAPSVSPDGSQVVFPSLQANNQAGLFRDGSELTHETTARAVVSRVSLLQPEGPTEESRKIFDDRDLAIDAAFSSYGDWLYVAMLGTQTVDVLDAYTLETVGSYQGLGEGLRGLWIDPEENRLWVLAELSREVAVVPLPGGEPETQPANLLRLDLRPGGVEILSSELLRGKQLFYSASDPRVSRDGYLSCGSCHLDGGQDGRVWDFTDRGEGLRNTPDLRGRGGATSRPIHWSGNFDEIQDFEVDFRDSMGGTGFLTEAQWQETSESLGPPKTGLSSDLDALAAFVESLDRVPRSPFRRADGMMTEEALAGAILFEDEEVGCVGCHPSPDYTDSEWLADGVPLLHDVGSITPGSGNRLGASLDGINTPSLLGVWSSAPYLHSGSSLTIIELLGDGGHSGVALGGRPLSEQERSQLEAFLLQLE